MKPGEITFKDKQDNRSKAIRALEKVKNNKIEKKKVSVRIDSKTILMVSKKKARQLRKCLKKN